MKKVLVLYYSQTGQLNAVVDSFTTPLRETDTVEVVYQNIEPKKPFPFPWGLIDFFDIFPESVHMDGCEIKALKQLDDTEFDLVILAYTVWFLSPSLPISGFLNSDAARVLKNKPVITLIACRNMWLMAQEKMKAKLASLGAILVDNVVLVDRGSSLATFITTPRWMWTGKKDAFWGLPEAGVDPNEIKRATRFGEALKDALDNDLEKSGRPLLKGLGAVNVDVKLIASERIAHRSFLIWSKLIKRFGSVGDKKRIPVLVIYFFFLWTLIFTVVPVTMLIKPLIRKLNREKVEQEKVYFEQPSGSDVQIK
jgi:hypothetical protein